MFFHALFADSVVEIAASPRLATLRAEFMLKLPTRCSAPTPATPTTPPATVKTIPESFRRLFLFDKYCFMPNFSPLFWASSFCCFILFIISLEETPNLIAAAAAMPAGPNAAKPLYKPTLTRSLASL